MRVQPQARGVRPTGALLHTSPPHLARSPTSFCHQKTYFHLWRARRVLEAPLVDRSRRVGGASGAVADTPNGGGCHRANARRRAAAAAAAATTAEADGRNPASGARQHVPTVGGHATTVTTATAAGATTAAAAGGPTVGRAPARSEVAEEARDHQSSLADGHGHPPGRLLTRPASAADPPHARRCRCCCCGSSLSPPQPPLRGTAGVDNGGGGTLRW